MYNAFLFGCIVPELSGQFVLKMCWCAEIGVFLWQIMLAFFGFVGEYMVRYLKKMFKVRLVLRVRLWLTREINAVLLGVWCTCHKWTRTVG
eukprot:m.745141 g.745141  ORF g.745141 m.745141 type:complete len:91 (+) comp23126_c1_seq6:70-342(+)